MGTKLAVVSSNLVVAFDEVKMFALLSQLCPQDFVESFIRNQFQFLDDVFHKWFDNFDRESFYSMINDLEPYLKFIFENPSKSLNFLDINIRIVENNLVFDIHYKHYKLSNSFNSLTCSQVLIHHTQRTIYRFHQQKRIVSIVTNNREKRLK